MILDEYNRWISEQATKSCRFWSEIAPTPDSPATSFASNGTVRRGPSAYVSSRNSRNPMRYPSN